MMNERVGNLDNLLFDLDGTLVDTSEGILNSAKYALDRLGIRLLRLAGAVLRGALVKGVRRGAGTFPA